MKGTQPMGSSDTSSELEKCVARITGLEGENRELRKESNGFQVRIRELDGLLDMAKREKREAIAEAAKFEGERDVARKEADAKASGLERNAEELGRNLEASRVEITRLTAEVTRLQTEAADARTAMSKAEEARDKSEAERAEAAKQLAQMIKDKGEQERLHHEAIAAAQAVSDAAQIAFNEKVAAETDKINVEQALSTAKLEAERVEDALKRRITAKDDEIKDLHERLIRTLSGK